MTDPRSALQPGDTLLIVDVQIDFCPGGALPIEQGDAVVPVLNTWIDAAVAARIPIYASRDWHPAHHLSFKESGGDWPVHCLQDQRGAAFHPGLKLPPSAIVVTKGTRFDRDQYSAFDETGLGAELKKKGVKRVWVGGLALDVCVRATALDARRLGFDTILIEDAARPVSTAGGEAAVSEMRAAGVRVD